MAVSLGGVGAAAGVRWGALVAGTEVAVDSGAVVGGMGVAVGWGDIVVGTCVASGATVGEALLHPAMSNAHTLAKNTKRTKVLISNLPFYVYLYTPICPQLYSER
jgi:hypothetical protein